MEIWDQHVHSRYSKDAFSGMIEMALAEAAAGIDGICFTDHCDLEHYDTGLEDADCWRPEELFSEFKAAKEAVDGKICLHIGLELGSGNHLPQRAEEINKSSLDFIIGSVHNLRGMPDFYMGTVGAQMYTSHEVCYGLLGRYIDEYIELVHYGFLDVLGHIGYPLRYMRKMGFDVSLKPLTDRLTLLLKTVIESGKGIELNTSGYRKWLSEPLPAPFILELYHTLGGEIITVGSDAHTPSEAGADVKKCLTLLRDLGYKYYCVYKDRKPEFIRLDL
jgi:histidinol-phosphatase (PHP family)